MTRIEFAPEVTEDFERIMDHLRSHHVELFQERIDQIICAIDVLSANPEIGRPVYGELRELIVGKGSQGYVALYRYIPEVDVVFVLGIRGQREAGYPAV